MAKSKPKATSTTQIIVLSGGTGRTADQLLRAALAQFPGSDANVVLHTAVTTKRKAITIVKQAAAQGALLCHSIVVPELRHAIDTQARHDNVPCIDVMGPALALIGDHLKCAPRGKAGLMYELHREQIDRMDAMDFTLAHDDGQRLQTIKKADVVLVGASRTTKSVTCCYLAFRGIRAANVPLIPNHPLPKELSRIPHRRVIGLTMNAAHLESIRITRVDRMSDRHVPRYADMQDIRRELRDIRGVMADHEWECIDVSYKATEEVAAQIIDLLPQRRIQRRIQRRTKRTAG